MSKQYYDSASYATGNSVGYLVKRAHALNLDALEPELAKHGLTFTQYAVLMAVRDGIALNPKDLCVQLRHDSGALTRVLDQLESRGLIERQRSTEDRRAIEVHLTGAGEDTLAAVVPLVVNRLNQTLKDFSHAEIDELLRLLNKLIGGWQNVLGGHEGSH